MTDHGYTPREQLYLTHYFIAVHAVRLQRDGSVILVGSSSWFTCHSARATPTGRWHCKHLPSYVRALRAAVFGCPVADGKHLADGGALGGPCDAPLCRVLNSAKRYIAWPTKGQYRAPPCPPAGSQYSCQSIVKLHILPRASMGFLSVHGVVRGRRGQQLGFALPTASCTSQILKFSNSQILKF